MPSEQKPIAGLPDNAPVDTRQRRGRGAPDGSMTMTVWTLSGVVLASCGGGGGGAGSTTNPPPTRTSFQGIVTDGPVRGARVYVDENNNGEFDAGIDTPAGTTDSTGQVTIDIAHREKVLVVDLDGAVDIATGRVLAGRWRSLDVNLYPEDSPVVVSPLTDLVAGQSSRAEAVLNRIFGQDVISVADIRNAENYDITRDNVEAQVIARAAIALTEIGKKSGLGNGNTPLEKLADFFAIWRGKPDQSTFNENTDLRVGTLKDAVQNAERNNDPADFTSGNTGVDGLVENAVAASRVVYTAHATPDIIDATITYALEKGVDDNDLFAIDETNGEIRFKNADDADYERAGVPDGIYNIRITATATHGDDITHAYQAVTIRLADANDLQPEFTSGNVGITGLVENRVASGDAVYTARAIPDIAAANVIYRRDDGVLDNDIFNIDRISGAVTFISAGDADYEHANAEDGVFEIEITAIATHATGTTTDKQRVTIRLADANDLPPEFTSGREGVPGLVENMVTPDTFVYTAEATPDITAAEITYSLAKGIEDNDLFDIDRIRGTVTFGSSNDADSEHDQIDNNVFTIVVTATATHGADITSADRRVTITIENLNDQPPNFTSGDRGVGGLVENAVTANDIVYTARATPDHAAAEVTYELVEGADDNRLFTIIDAGNGEVRFKNADDADYERAGAPDGIYNILVMATATHRTFTTIAEQRITITIGDANDLPPEFTSGDEGVDGLIENAVSTGEAVYTATATPDIPAAQVTYSLARGVKDNNLFNIDRISGAVTFADTDYADYEHPDATNGAFEITITATATHATGTTTETHEVTIRLIDANDAPILETSAVIYSNGGGIGAANETASFAATASDPDGTQPTLSITAAGANIRVNSGIVTGIANEYGNLDTDMPIGMIERAGDTWTFTANTAAISALAGGERETITFNITASDGIDTTTESVRINIGDGIPGNTDFTGLPDTLWFYPGDTPLPAFNRALPEFALGDFSFAASTLNFDSTIVSRKPNTFIEKEFTIEGFDARIRNLAGTRMDENGRIITNTIDELVIRYDDTLYPEDTNTSSLAYRPNFRYVSATGRIMGPNNLSVAWTGSVDGDGNLAINAVHDGATLWQTTLNANTPFSRNIDFRDFILPEIVVAVGGDEGAIHAVLTAEDGTPDSVGEELTIDLSAYEQYHRDYNLPGTLSYTFAWLDDPTPNPRDAFELEDVTEQTYTTTREGRYAGLTTVTVTDGDETREFLILTPWEHITGPTATMGLVEPILTNSIQRPAAGIITTDDTNAFESLTFVGRMKARLKTGSKPDAVPDNVYIFTASYVDGTEVELRANPVFEDREKAESAVAPVARAIGNLPWLLRDPIGHVVINNGEGRAHAYASSRFFVMFEETNDLYQENDVLEEVVFHEAIHTSDVEYTFRRRPGWVEAVEADRDNRITQYARTNYAEDIAEAALLAWSLIRHPGRLAERIETLIRDIIPNRLEVFKKFFTDASITEVTAATLPNILAETTERDVTEVNNPGANRNQDNVYRFNNFRDFDFLDLNNDKLQAIRLVDIPDGVTVRNGNDRLSDGDSFLITDIAAITITIDTDYASGTRGYAFTYQVQDSSDAWSTDEGVFTLNVASTPDAPRFPAPIAGIDTATRADTPVIYYLRATDEDDGEMLEFALPDDTTALIQSGDVSYSAGNILAATGYGSAPEGTVIGTLAFAGNTPATSPKTAQIIFTPNAAAFSHLVKGARESFTVRVEARDDEPLSPHTSVDVTFTIAKLEPVQLRHSFATTPDGTAQTDNDDLLTPENTITTIALADQTGGSVKAGRFRAYLPDHNRLNNTGDGVFGSVGAAVTYLDVNDNGALDIGTDTVHDRSPGGVLFFGSTGIWQYHLNSLQWLGAGDNLIQTIPVSFTPATTDTYAPPVEDAVLTFIIERGDAVLDEDDTHTITSAELGNGPAAVYTVTATPDNGTLSKSGSALGIGESFTQGDIDNGSIAYEHDGSETIHDGFAYRLGDGSAGSFTFAIARVNDVPVLGGDMVATLDRNDDYTITDTDLDATDGDHTASQLTYIITTAPENGKLKRSDVALERFDTFTQSDIDNDRITYDHDGSDTTGDSFEFRLSDGIKSLSGTFTFTITSSPPGNAPPQKTQGMVYDALFSPDNGQNQDDDIPPPVSEII